MVTKRSHRHCVRLWNATDRFFLLGVMKGLVYSALSLGGFWILLRFLAMQDGVLSGRDRTTVYLVGAVSYLLLENLMLFGTREVSRAMGVDKVCGNGTTSIEGK